MSEIRFKFVIVYMISLISAYLLGKVTNRIATKTINEEKLSTGIYWFYPIEGKRAVELAKSYIRGVNIYFWFIVLIFPFMYILALIQGSI
jgi:hypothetical protein